MVISDVLLLYLLPDQLHVLRSRRLLELVVELR